MPRKRYIKPGFFKNEELAALPPLVRIFFQGLWCWADREGRLEDRPKRLKTEIMPYDKINIEAALDRLEKAGFIERYNSSGVHREFIGSSSGVHRELQWIQVVNFKKHQDVNVKEAASIIPDIQLIKIKKHGANTVKEQGNNSANTPYNLELRTLNLELNKEVVVVNSAESKKNEFNETVDEYFENRDKNNNASFPESAYIPDEQKEKSSAQKEKLIPTLEEAMLKCAETAHCRNVIEHWLKPKDIELTSDTLLELQYERESLFQIFYEQKEDEYKARGRPTYTDMAKNFYFWVNIHRNSTLKQLKSKLNDNTLTKTTGNRARTEENKRGVEALMQRSAEFLRKSAG